MFALADRITVMRGGKIAASGPTTDFTMRDVVSHMLGFDHAQAEKKAIGSKSDVGDRGLRILSLTSRGHFRDVSFDASAGSVLALFGQVGSGADDLVKVLAGLGRVASRAAMLRGEPLPLRSRHQTQKGGIAYVSADRVAEGVFLNASVTTNVSSGALTEVSDMRIIRRSKERKLAQEQARSVSLDPSRIRENAYAFSGGNQQKIAIARALATRPTVLILNEPTRGVDIGARAEVYRSIRNLLEDDVIVVAYSSDIVEIRELADQVITMYRGGVVGSHRVDDVDDSVLITEILTGVPG